jgi:hypothetical protein
MTTRSHIFQLFLIILLGMCLGVRAEEIQVTKARSMQEVKSLSAALVNGLPIGAGKKFKKPVIYAFYVALGDPVPFSEEALQKLAGNGLARSRVSEEEVMNMTMMEASQYFVLLDDKQKVVCLLAKHGGRRISLSRVVEAGHNVFQNDPKGGMGTYHDFEFP